MANIKLAKIIAKLLERTKVGSVTWEETGGREVFQAAFPGYTIQVFSKDNEDEPDQLDYVVRIVNEEGKVLEEVADPELRDVMEKPLETMKELYTLARRSALGVDDALNRILSSLEEKDVPF